MRRQGCRPERSTRKPTWYYSSLGSVEACQGKVAVCRGVKMLPPDMFDPYCCCSLTRLVSVRLTDIDATKVILELCYNILVNTSIDTRARYQRGGFTNETYRTTDSAIYTKTSPASCMPLLLLLSVTAALLSALPVPNAVMLPGVKCQVSRERAYSMGCSRAASNLSGKVGSWVGSGTGHSTVSVKPLG